eukprot:2338811-Prymnesium_polylepis.1
MLKAPAPSLGRGNQQPRTRHRVQGSARSCVSRHTQRARFPRLQCVHGIFPRSEKKRMQAQCRGKRPMGSIFVSLGALALTAAVIRLARGRHRTAYRRGGRARPKEPAPPARTKAAWIVGACAASGVRVNGLRTGTRRTNMARVRDAQTTRAAGAGCVCVNGLRGRVCVVC